jgi:hypothetical protein
MVQGVVILTHTKNSCNATQFFELWVVKNI